MQTTFEKKILVPIQPHQSHTASLWLDEEYLYFSNSSSNHSPGDVEIEQVQWNPDRISLLNPGAQELLSASLQSLFRSHNATRNAIRLILADRMCVTRIARGDREEVNREVQNIRQRSQLYLSLGLGDKLACHSIADGFHNGQYAITAIMNLRVAEMVYRAFSAIGLNLISMEPNALLLTEALAELVTEQSEPNLIIVADGDACDLHVCKNGRLMLSYRIGPFESPEEAGKKVASNMARLRRFCNQQKLSAQGNLPTIVVFGDDHTIAPLQKTLRDELQNVWITSIDELSSSKPKNISDRCSPIRTAIWTSRTNSLNDSELSGIPRPNIVGEIIARQPKSFYYRAARIFWPSALAATLMLLIFSGLQFRHVSISNQQSVMEETLFEVATAEEEIDDWESKQLLIANYEQLERELKSADWNKMIKQIAQCLPSNARLSTFGVNEMNVLSLRGEIAGEDTSYEMLAAIKRLPFIQNVTIESIGSTFTQKKRRQQFDIRCIVEKNKNSHFVSTRSNPKL